MDNQYLYTAIRKMYDEHYIKYTIYIYKKPKYVNYTKTNYRKLKRFK